MTICPDCDMELVSPRLGHDCHCVHDGPTRIGWGICCARVVGAKLMAEEDEARGEVWAKEESKQ